MSDKIKMGLIYEYVKDAIQSGRYAPGDRIVPARLAKRFGTSLTPVRAGLYRLHSDGLIVADERGGIYVTLVSELTLRSQYDWMAQMLAAAWTIGPSAPGRDEAIPELQKDMTDAELVRLTGQLFASIARATRHDAFQDSLNYLNSRLGPVRYAELKVFDDARDELARLYGHWHRAELDALTSALADYHERRKHHVPCIVGIMRGADPLPCG